MHGGGLEISYPELLLSGPTNPSDDAVASQAFLFASGSQGGGLPSTAALGASAKTVGNVAGILPALDQPRTGGLALDPGAASEKVRDRQMGLPMLDSKPGAPATIYLDFTGNHEDDWSYNAGNGTQVHYNNYITTPLADRRDVTTPRFDRNYDPTTFDANEKAIITEIWSRVAEDFAPFNVNVSTDYYGSFNNQQALHVVIGGSSQDWLKENTSGIASIGSFSDSAPNVVFVFDLFAWEDAKVGDWEGHTINGIAATASTASHEAGHAFGLRHHSIYAFEEDLFGDEHERINEYDPGNAGWTPIMGNSLAADRTTWDSGPTDRGWNTLQNDMEILAGPANGFGFRADDHGNTIATADALNVVVALGKPLTANGIVNSMVDVDVFKFTSTGGPLLIRVNAAKYSPNLIPVAELWSNDGFVARADAGSLTESIIHQTSLQAGTYFILVKGFGDYGDVGQYTVSASFGQALSQGYSLLLKSSSTDAGQGINDFLNPSTPFATVAYARAQQFTSTGALATSKGSSSAGVGINTLVEGQPTAKKPVLVAIPSTTKAHSGQVLTPLGKLSLAIRDSIFDELGAATPAKELAGIPRI